MKYWSLLILTGIIHAEINLIATPACTFDTIDKQSIKALFMKKRTRFQHNIVKVYDNRDLYTDFVTQFIQKSPTKMNIYWTRMIFTGTKKPPKKLPENELIHQLPAQNECRLSYSSKVPKKGWKTIHVSP